MRRESPHHTGAATSAVGALRFHALRARRLPHALLGVVLVVLSLAMALHHSGVAMGGMHHGHGDEGHGAVASMCVGMAVAGIAVEGLVLVRRTRRNGRRSPRRPAARRALSAAALSRAPGAAARADPSRHLQLCVIRR